MSDLVYNDEGTKAKFAAFAYYTIYVQFLVFFSQDKMEAARLLRYLLLSRDSHINLRLEFET